MRTGSSKASRGKGAGVEVRKWRQRRKEVFSVDVMTKLFQQATSFPLESRELAPERVPPPKLGRFGGS
jgi:hypothetical protein